MLYGRSLIDRDDSSRAGAGFKVSVGHGSAPIASRGLKSFAARLAV
jgi:hypothetical protein